MHSSQELLSLCISLPHTYYAMRDGPTVRTFPVSVFPLLLPLVVTDLPHTPRSIDIAYGYTSCAQLPLGLFDRSCASYGGLKKKDDGTFTTPVCPNQAGGEGFCNGDLSARNADTYSHIAAGVYFSRQCNRAIPYPQPVTLAARAQTRNTAPQAQSVKVETTAHAEKLSVIPKPSKRELGPVTPLKEARHPHDSRRVSRTLHEEGSVALHQSKPRADGLSVHRRLHCLGWR
ncbi:hypothetical protein DL546_002162 [Coniochaeta pulveracea]|uniref:Uncharacterized protein n=1 Tax=Coniochaeta pulveracea TaxID=177199 RepID=A0A420Y1L5_9PEZI|nr:hypothetical protein DL546_002162 [Coniochaeta pulveracea]